MNKQVKELRYACNLEADNAIGETNERAFTKRRRIMYRKLQKKG